MNKSELSHYQIEDLVYLVRGQKVMLDSDLANLYEVTSKRLNEQVKRNRKRFPEDFMFQLTKEEHEILRSQIATLKENAGLKSQNATSNRGGRGRGVIFIRKPMNRFCGYMMNNSPRMNSWAARNIAQKYIEKPIASAMG
jgi:hypothetical protein